jgi:hypothetical protein
MTHDAILGFSYDDDGKATIDTTMLRMFAGAKLRRYEPLLETDLDPGVREIAETGVAALRALDALTSTTLSLAEELARAEQAKPAPIIRTRRVDRDERGLIRATEDRDEVQP